ncbi:Ras family protein [Histomonas meleagridis]|uniref:Ras family protein n=1 Tax=Histomonas meleagridis TaxID=135588 RepID=UPI003559C91A|nr:Ras family protein [Histomonas meleagridis]KAH0801259.1 Ras family protein [Histomonas meleagridis]
MLVDDDKVTFRVVTIGDSSVGKTCIANRFLKDFFDSNQTTTIGAAIDSFIEERDGQKIEIQICDTAGQEQYKSLGSVYYRGASAVFFVFDITNKKSFKNLDSWLKSYQESGSNNAIFFLVGNKSDLVEERDVDNSEIEKWANTYNAKYFETSAKTGNNIKELYNALVDALFESIIKTIPQVNSVLRPEYEEKSEHKQSGCC